MADSYADSVRLWAISDLHVEHEPSRRGLEALGVHGDDWLILAGDVANSVRGLAWTLDVLAGKFAQLIWVPGNHELWAPPDAGPDDRGEARYAKLVAACRERGVWTPEDDYPVWEAAPRPTRIAPLFLLYDYTFAPDAHTGRERAVQWAAEEGIVAADEYYVDPSPHPSREAWCEARVAATQPRLQAASQAHELVLINHWPLRRDLVRLGPVPRYSPWCGTRQTEDWHRRFRARVCVHGHLHVRASDERDGTRFEEVSLGYPAHWQHARGVEHYLRPILELA